MHYFVWPVEVCTPLRASRPVLEIDEDKWSILSGVRPVLRGVKSLLMENYCTGICFLNWIMNGRRRELARREVEGRLRSPGVEGTNRVILFKGTEMLWGSQGEVRHLYIKGLAVEKIYGNNNNGKRKKGSLMFHVLLKIQKGSPLNSLYPRPSPYY